MAVFEGVTIVWLLGHILQLAKVVPESLDKCGLCKAIANWKPSFLRAPKLGICVNLGLGRRQKSSVEN